MSRPTGGPEVEGSTLARAQQHAARAARDLEQRLASGDPADLDLLSEACELDAHADGALSIVLDVRGPYVALVLGRRDPHVEVWWGGSVAREAVELDPAAVARFVTTWWGPARESVEAF